MILIKMGLQIFTRASSGNGSGAEGAGSRRSVSDDPSSLKTLLIWMSYASHRYYYPSFLTKGWEHGAETVNCTILAAIVNATRLQ